MRDQRARAVAILAVLARGAVLADAGGFLCGDRRETESGMNRSCRGVGEIMITKTIDIPYGLGHDCIYYCLAVYTHKFVYIYTTDSLSLSLPQGILLIYLSPIPIYFIIHVYSLFHVDTAYKP